MAFVDVGNSRRNIHLLGTGLPHQGELAEANSLYCLLDSNYFLSRVRLLEENSAELKMQWKGCLRNEAKMRHISSILLAMTFYGCSLGCGALGGHYFPAWNSIAYIAASFVCLFFMWMTIFLIEEDL